MAVASETCVIEIPGVSHELLAFLDEQVRRVGVTREEYIRQLLERELHESRRAGGPTFAEILGPARGGADVPKVTQEGFQESIEDEVRAYRAEHRAKRAR